MDRRNLPKGSWGISTALVGVLTPLILVACSGEEDTIPIVSPTTPLPEVTITTFSPTTATVGEILSFTFSAQLFVPAGIGATDPILVTVTPPLGARTPFLTLDADQIPNCSVGSSQCTLTNVIVDTSSQGPLAVTGTHEVTVSVLDLQGRVGADTQEIQVGL